MGAMRDELMWIHDDVARLGHALETFENEQRRNAIGKADFEADRRFDRGDDFSQKAALVDGNVRMDFVDIATFRNRAIGGNQFRQDRVHEAKSSARWSRKSCK